MCYSKANKLILYVLIQTNKVQYGYFLFLCSCDLCVYRLEEVISPKVFIRFLVNSKLNPTLTLKLTQTLILSSKKQLSDADEYPSFGFI